MHLFPSDQPRQRCLRCSLYLCVDAPSLAIHRHHDRETFDADDPESLGDAKIVLLMNRHYLPDGVRDERGRSAYSVGELSPYKAGDPARSLQAFPHDAQRWYQGRVALSILKRQRLPSLLWPFCVGSTYSLTILCIPCHWTRSVLSRRLEIVEEFKLL